ncbi:MULTISPECIES: hypothetical protein [Klebsiella/Raoultella group]
MERFNQTYPMGIIVSYLFRILDNLSEMTECREKNIKANGLIRL